MAGLSFFGCLNTPLAKEERAKMIATEFVRNSLTPHAVQFVKFPPTRARQIKPATYEVSGPVDVEVEGGQVQHSHWDVEVTYQGRGNWYVNRLTMDGQVVVGDGTEKATPTSPPSSPPSVASGDGSPRRF